MTARRLLTRETGRAALLLLAVCARSGAAQTSTGAADVAKPSGGVVIPVLPSAGRPAEAAVVGLARKDADTVALTLPGSELLHDFEVDGVPVRTSKLHFKQTVPGVVEITSLAYPGASWRFHVRDAGNYYGLGERPDALNHARTIVMNAMEGRGDWSAKAATSNGDSSSKPVPFFMSTTGYGLWVDTTSEAVFDMNGSSADDIVVDVPVARLRIVLFVGPEFAGILDKFTQVAGRATLPPMWAFAPWMGRRVGPDGAGETQVQAIEDVERTRELGLPASVILIDAPWAAGGGYTFEPKQFADEAGMVKHLHETGYKLVVGVAPWIVLETEAYKQAATEGYFVKTETGAPFVGPMGAGQGSALDFSNTVTRRWWQEQVRQALAAGADGFDAADGAGTFVGAVKFADGLDPRLMRNRYAGLYQGAAEELIEKDLKGNGVMLAQNATAGFGGAGFLLAGAHRVSFSPEDGLATAVTDGLGAGLSGMPLWTAEMGAGIADAAVFTRWAEFAAFSPVMVTTAGPWDFDDAALEAYRKYAVLHMSLFPYRYAAAMQAAATGMPVMRALVLAYQNDERARTAKDEYLFGPDMLVAPVTDESTARLVYLPAGYWVNYWTGSQVSGGKTVMADAPLETIPVYVRLGAVIPKIPDDVMTLVPPPESGNAQIHMLDGRRVYELVGPSAEGETAITDFEGRKLVRSGTTLKISGKAGHVIVRWRFAPVRSVTVNGAVASLQKGKDGPFVEFNHDGESLVQWQ